ncbi:MAG: 50S ribosomal protein L11 methyltransferase [Desulfobacteraceae bacterium]|nr:50S ribosomal protein L11 methyltransferase [Desulfobacteraceae bacterium]
MKWVEAKVLFDATGNTAVSDLISEIFYDFGLQGVTVETPEIEPGLDWAETEFAVPAHHAVTGYFPKNEDLPEKCRILEARMAALKQALDMDNKTSLTYTIGYRDLDEQDWAESWKQYFYTEKITDRIVINPSWRNYAPAPGEIVLEIDPGMAFGTGTHPTTRMCIRLIEKWMKPGDTFLDVGTGSGILMLAAAKLGAETMTGIDNDAVAVAVASQNLQKNNIHPDSYDIRTGNLAGGVSGQFSLVAANILSEVIMTLIDDLPPVLAKNGIFICSGIIQPKQAMIENKLTSQGFEIIEVLNIEEWVAIAATRKLQERGKPIGIKKGHPCAIAQGCPNCLEVRLNYSDIGCGRPFLALLDVKSNPVAVI